MKKQLCVSVVGCGYWGPNLIRNFRGLPDCTLKSICDVSHDRLRHLKGLYPEVEAETSYEKLLTDAGVDAIAIATGPGGFTGLRVSIACAKALALARDVKLIALPSARVFAASDVARGGNGPWLIALAAKNDSAWCIHAATRRESASFQADSINFDAASILGADEFAARVTLIAREGGALLADEHLGSELTQLAVAAGLTQRALQTDSATLATLAVQAFARNDFIDPYAIAPIYAREPEAVTKWRALHDA